MTMRMYDIALFIFIFQLCLGLVKTMDLDAIAGTGMSSDICIAKDSNGVCTQSVTPEEYAQMQSSNVEAMSSKMQESSISIQAVFSWFNVVFMAVVNGIPTILDFFINATVGIYLILTAMGVPTLFATAIQSMVYLVYFIGGMQYWIGRSMREYQ